MAQFSRTWWGQEFIKALEQFTEPSRLGRGRSYARGGKVKSFEIEDGIVTALVRGSVNPYFGVYTEPLYTTTLEITPISKAKWAAVIALMATKASLISRLMLNEIPDTLEEAFATLGLHLLPHSEQDFKTDCSCPDWSNPCKHIAGVYYLIAAELDRDPFLLFELRGISRQDLKAELAKTPLGQALSSELTAQPKALDPVQAYYTRPKVEEGVTPNLKNFWQGEKRLPQTIEAPPQTTVPALMIKKQGDLPPFWHRDNSFIEVMEELYERVKTKNKTIL
ncbi:MAG TPA: SWIM zinc finger family protein [Leptolyngbyaceae cyanobacterium]